MASIKFIVKGSSITSSIYLRFKEGREIDITGKTKYIVNPKDWSSAKGQPKNLNDESLKQLNGNLKDLSAKLLKHYNNTNNKLEVNSKWLKDFFNPPEKQLIVPSKLIAYYDFYSEQRASEIGYTTQKKLGVQKNLLERFQKDSKTEFFIQDINTNFKLKLEAYCLSNNYAPNTISQLIKTIKTICYHAQSNGIEVNNQLNTISIKWQKVDNIHLDLNELTRIEDALLENENLINTRDWLLISCETGQRVSDFMRFKKSMIRYELNNKKEKKALLEFTQVKTNKIMTIPLSKKVLKILEKRDGEFPKPITDQKYNGFLKDVCNLAKINAKVSGSIAEVKDNVKRKKPGVYEKWKLVTSHIGRRSFASNNYGIIPTPLLMSATGHSTEKQFLEYIGKTDTQKAMQLADYF